MSGAVRIAIAAGVAVLFRTGALSGAPVCEAPPARSSAGALLRPAPAFPAPGPGDRFGATVAIGEKIIAVGAHLFGEDDSGAVYLFQKTGTPCQWTQTAFLPGTPGAQFGFDITLGGPPDRMEMIVGAPFARVGGVRSGAAYRFALSPDGTATALGGALPIAGREGDQIGSSVAFHQRDAGSAIVVGARGDDGEGPEAGAVYVLRDDRPPVKLTAGRGSAGGELGQSVSFDGDTLVAGAPQPNGSTAGAAYVFRFEAGQWERSALTLPGGNRPGDAFGYAVAVQGDQLLVGAPLADGAAGREDSGAVYIYRRTAGGWSQPVPLEFESGPRDQFGVSVAVDRGRSLVGARRAEGTRGAAYLFSAEGCLTDVLISPSAQVEAEFGFAVAMRGPLRVIAAFLQDLQTGAAYVFEDPQTVEEVRFASAASQEPEGRGEISLDVEVRTSDGCPVTAAVTTDVEVRGGTAIRNLDFALITTSLEIRAGARQGTVKATITPDTLKEPDETFTLILSEGLSEHTVTILDDDGPGILLLPTEPPPPLNTSENGTADSFTVQLATRPSAGVTISLAGDSSEGLLSTSLVTFTPENWNVPQEVTVTGVDDTLFDGDVLYPILATAASADPAYRGRRATVQVLNRDNDNTQISGTKRVCVFADDTVLYTVALVNAGTVTQQDQPGDEFTDILPWDKLSLLMAVADSGTATVDLASNTASWNGPIPPRGVPVTITLIAALQPGVVPGDVVSNQGAIFYDRDNRDGKESAVPTDDPASPGAQDPTVFTVGAAPVCASTRQGPATSASPAVTPTTTSASRLAGEGRRSYEGGSWDGCSAVPRSAEGS